MFEWLIDFFKRKTKDEDDFWSDEENRSAVDRRRMDLSEPDQMERYVRSCCEQMLEATEEIDQATVEYRFITQNLTDMEEIEQLPKDIRKKINDCASKLLELEDARVGMQRERTGMPETQYRLIERHEDKLPDTIHDLEENENYKLLIKQDLQNLEGEKVSYRFRRYELYRKEKRSREFAVILCFMAVFVLMTMFVLQYEFHKDMGYGYVVAVAFFALLLTVMFMIFSNSRTERHIVEKHLNMAITTQNTVKIRYVNTTNVIEAIYQRYNIRAVSELKYIWNKYLQEKKERENVRETDEKIALLQKDLLDKLKGARISSPEMWLDRAQALLDPREMVEIRHDFIGRRQSLRKRIEYNEDNRQAAREEVTGLIKKYPSMAPLIMGIVEEYD